MGIDSFLSYIEENLEGAVGNVDLLQISRGSCTGYPAGEPSMSLVIDADSCLDRLYGGYFSDWVCGGQWNKVMDYLTNLASICRNSGIQLVAFFDGTLEGTRTSEWVEQQISHRKKVNLILKHISNKSTPPPKIWWIPPGGLIPALKSGLRQVGIGVATSVEDHHQEIINFIRSNRFHGLLAHGGTYCIFDPPRYFSSQALKLTYKGSLETKEIFMDEAARQIDLNPDRFCVLAALIGNHILTEESLQSFHKKLLKQSKAEKVEGKSDQDGNHLMDSLITFVRDQQSVDDTDKLCKIIFEESTVNRDTKVELFKQSVAYYFKGTVSGFVKYGPRSSHKSSKKESSPAKQSKSKGSVNGEKNEVSNESGYASPQNPKDPSKQFDLAAPGEKSGATEEKKPGTAPGSFVASSKRGATASGGTSLPSLPAVPPEVLKISVERHADGVMSPWVLHVLTKGEIRLPVSLENELDSELPLSVDLYRPMRANAYAVLFSIKPYRKKKDGEEPPPQPEVYIKEASVIRPTQGSLRPSIEVVRATPLDWLTPSLKRLWLGTQQEDKDRRMRAFLSCMESDSALMMNQSCVPRPLLLASCVLRYVLQHKQRRVLRKHELDAFLSMMVSPRLHDSAYTQDLQLPMISPRAVQLAALFMRGVEHASFVNDVCGAPLSSDICCPWLYIDGKLLHLKLLRSSNTNMSLLDLCDGQMDQMMAVEGLRQAILEGIVVDFAQPPLPMHLPGFHQHPQMSPRFPGPYGGGEGFNRSPGRNRSGNSSGMDSRGGQLEVAGMVVGSWSANKGRGRGGIQQPPTGPHQQSYRPQHNYTPAGARLNSAPSIRSAAPSGKPAQRGRGGYKSMARGRGGLQTKPDRDHRPGAGIGRGLTVEHCTSSLMQSSPNPGSTKPLNAMNHTIGSSSLSSGLTHLSHSPGVGAMSSVQSPNTHSSNHMATAANLSRPATHLQQTTSAPLSHLNLMSSASQQPSYPGQQQYSSGYTETQQQQPIAMIDGLHISHQQPQLDQHNVQTSGSRFLLQDTSANTMIPDPLAMSSSLMGAVGMERR